MSEWPGRPARPPQFFWLWAPVNFDDLCTHFDVNEAADGQQWHHSGFIVPVLPDADNDPVRDTGGLAVSAEPMSSVSCHIDWEPGTRRAAHAQIELTPWNAESLTVALEPFATFQMMGIGYFHPEWAHGVWKGDLATGGDRWTVADLDPLGLPHVPSRRCAGQRCRTGPERKGLGILEQLVIGEHEPSGFQSILDGAP